MKYIGYLEMEAGKTSRFMRKVIENDDLLIVFKNVWDESNEMHKIGEIYAEVEPNLFQHIVTIVPVGYLGSVKTHG